MRKSILIALALVIVLGLNAYALETTVLDVNNKIFEEAGLIKPLLKDSKDIVLMNSMWDSCIITKTQLDAYFFMIAIFNTIKEKDSIDKAADYLINWLNAVKKTNELNMKSLSSITQLLEPTTEMHIKKLNGYFAELNFKIDQELKNISEIKAASKIKKQVE
jgi:hypothetical protein